MNTPASNQSHRQLRASLWLWWHLHRQLRRRGRGRNESGAFLLGRRAPSGVDRVARFVCYDDLDPHCLDRGYIEFRACGYEKLWAECRRLELDVLADVHTHPGPNSSQSGTDRTHPMISEAGHVAIILPSYAQGFAFRLGAASCYEYSGNYLWRDWSKQRRTRFRLSLF